MLHLPRSRTANFFMVVTLTPIILEKSVQQLIKRANSSPPSPQASSIIIRPEPEVEIISSVTEKSGIKDAATEEAIREQGEQIHPSDVEQPQLRPQTKPKKTG